MTALTGVLPRTLADLNLAALSAIANYRTADQEYRKKFPIAHIDDRDEKDPVVIAWRAALLTMGNAIADSIGLPAGQKQNWTGGNRAMFVYDKPEYPRGNVMTAAYYEMEKLATDPSVPLPGISR